MSDREMTNESLDKLGDEILNNQFPTATLFSKFAKKWPILMVELFKYIRDLKARGDRA